MLYCGCKGSLLYNGCQGKDGQGGEGGADPACDRQRYRNGKRAVQPVSAGGTESEEGPCETPDHSGGGAGPGSTGYGLPGREDRGKEQRDRKAEPAVGAAEAGRPGGCPHAGDGTGTDCFEQRGNTIGTGPGGL